MTSFQLRPGLIQAFQWTGRDHELPTWARNRVRLRFYENRERGEYLSFTELNGGPVEARPGDWVVKDQYGDLHAHPDWFFQQLYQEAPEPQEASA